MTAISKTVAPLNTREQALWDTQLKAEALFAQVVNQGLLRSGVLESTLSSDIHEVARKLFGLKRHWHRRIVRAGANTLLTYSDNPPDRIIGTDDIVYLDFGPVFGEWEADVGRSYVIGHDPRKHQLVTDIHAAFLQGQALYDKDPTLTAGQLYDCVASLATSLGWTFGASTAGHPIDRFPHEQNVGRKLSIRHGNSTALRAPQADGSTRHWILEIHFVDRQLGYGAFMEELLTIRGPRS